VCAGTEKTAAEWKEHLRAEIKKYAVEPLREKKAELDRTIGKLTNVATQIQQLIEKRDEEQRKLAELQRKAAESLKRTVSPQDDLEILLKAAVVESDNRLQKLRDQVSEINAKLGALDESVRHLNQFARICRTQAEIEQIENIHTRPSYAELNDLRRQYEQYAEDVALIIEGLQATVTELAKARLEAVRDVVFEIFKCLTERPDYPGLSVVTADDGYSIEVGDMATRTRAVPLLNHGDLNCAALSIFLGLAKSPQISHRLGLVILDDPSQSLDATCKSKLCDVLTDLCDSRQVILSTTDDQLVHDFMGIPKTKVALQLRDWNPESGPVLETISPSAYAL
jgi:DNA repair exonuclease SbcCD ATPase subunit